MAGVSVNTTTNTITVQQDNTRVIQVSTPGPQGPQGIQGPSGSLTGGIENYVAVWSSANNLSTGSIYSSGNFTAIRHFEGPENPAAPDILYINGAGVDTYNLVSAHGEQDGYVQLNIQNYSSGANASSDIVATRNDGNENSGYIDMGINSTLYSNTAYVGSAGDAYVYSTGENLYIGNATPSKQVVLFNGGLDAIANARVFIHDQGTTSINTDEVGPDPTNPPALFVHPTQVGASNFNMIVAEADVDNYSQIVLLNKNAGTFASADIVAQNDLGTETDHYVDMGINSSTHGTDYSFTVGEANDTYMLSVSTGGNHYIGSSKSSDIYLFTGDNFDGQTHAKAIFKANNQHQISGSLNISGSIILTGSSFTWNDNQILTTPSTTTGTVVSFTTNQVYNEWDVPGTGNITNDLTGAKTGIVQKIYHNSSVAPSVPAGWVVVSNGVYVPNVLNIIYAEWVKGTRVEYWITQ